MPVTVIVGGQFGSEGKGKVAHFWAHKTGVVAAVRVGGPNSGHTVIEPSGSSLILQHLPTASILPDVICILGAGSYINPTILLAEVERTRLDPERLLIDPNAVVITEREEIKEQSSSLRGSIGSTLSGTGAAVQKRIERDSFTKLAKQESLLKKFVTPTVPFMRSLLASGKRIVIEGTQGFGLSVLHSLEYPYVTSRDTTAAAFVSEAGLSPLDIDEVVMVLRAFPIRVGGNSGPLIEEITWSEVTTESGSLKPIFEHTSVTKAVRRVARFHPDIVRQAIMVNNPTHVVMNHIDHVDAICRESRIITNKATNFVEQVESLIGTHIDYVGVGPAMLLSREHLVNKLRSA